MTQPLVDQLRFARREFRRGLVGISDEEARRRFLPMNCISWNIGHLAWQEQRYWLRYPQGLLLLPEVDRQFAYGAPASTPPLADAWRAWETITAAADPWLDAVTTQTLLAEATRDGQLTGFTIGSRLLRMLYHYWFHIGENAAIRQCLGHTDLPDFVGDIEDEAPYRAECAD
ncbi:MAG: DinB family protein [Thermomicrobiales bacterium]